MEQQHENNVQRKQDQNDVHMNNDDDKHQQNLELKMNFNQLQTTDNTKPPLLDDGHIRKLCKQFYNLTEIINIEQLNSYDDRNYLLCLNSHSNDDKFVLKITNSYDTEQIGLLNGQNEMIIHLSKNHFNVPIPIKTINDNYLEIIHLPSNELNTMKAYAIRLFKYLDGIILYNVKNIHERLLIDCGEYLASIDLCLENFHNDTIHDRKFLWSLTNASNLMEYIDCINNISNKIVAEKCIKDFNEIIISSKNSMKHSYLHGDFNEQNILVKKIDENNESYKIEGIIDFGDIYYGPQIFDLAILIAYIMLLKFNGNSKHIDPIINAPNFIIQGYCKKISLTKKNIFDILICARARLCQSLIIGEHTYRMQPNNEYLLTTSKNGWPILHRLCNDYSDKELIEKWINNVDQIR